MILRREFSEENYREAFRIFNSVQNEFCVSFLKICLTPKFSGAVG